MVLLEAKYKTLYFIEFFRTKRKVLKPYVVHISWGFCVFLNTVQRSGTLLLKRCVHKQKQRSSNLIKKHLTLNL